MGIGRVYEALAEREIEAVIPPPPVTRPGSAKGFPVERFRYDAKRDLVRCARKKLLTPRSTTKTGRWFRAEADACRSCPLRERCIPDAGPMRDRRAGFTSALRTSPSCAPAANDGLGETGKPTSTAATAGWSKGPTGWPRTSTA